MTKDEMMRSFRDRFPELVAKSETDSDTRRELAVIFYMLQALFDIQLWPMDRKMTVLRQVAMSATQGIDEYRTSGYRVNGIDREMGGLEYLAYYYVLAAWFLPTEQVAALGIGEFAAAHTQSPSVSGRDRSDADGLWEDKKGQIAVFVRRECGLTVVDSGVVRFETVDGVDPARGFTWVKLEGREGEVVCCAIHLKANTFNNKKRSKEEESALNRRKRELASEQLAAFAARNSGCRMVVAGDFNTNSDQRMFDGERTFGILEKAGFRNCWSGVPLKERITHPGRGRYPDATFDYVFTRGWSAPSKMSIIPGTGISDHHLVVAELP